MEQILCKKKELENIVNNLLKDYSRTSLIQGYDMNSRLLRKAIITKYLKLIVPDQNKENKTVCLNKYGEINLLDYFDQKIKIGSKSKYGDVYTIKCKINKKLSFNIAVKLIPLSYKDRIHMYNTKFFAWRELRTLNLLNNLAKRRVCPNITMIYNWYICNNCKYQNINLKPLNSKMCILALIELADTDLRNWIIKKSKQKKIDYNISDQWYNIFFQIFVPIYTIYREYQIVHHDLHWGNVLITYIDSGGYWIYEIEGIKFYIPNLGLFIQICDFGKCQSKTQFVIRDDDILENKDINCIQNFDKDKSFSPNTDVVKITNIHNWVKSAFMIENKKIIPNDIITLLENIRLDSKVNTLKLIKAHFSKYLNNKIGKKIYKSDLKFLDRKPIKNISFLKIGDIVSYSKTGKYVLVNKFKSNMVSIIISIGFKMRKINVPLKDINKFSIDIEPDKSIHTYLKGDPIDIYRI